MAKNSNTVEIDNLLARVNKVANLASNTVKRFERKKYTLSDFSLPESMQWYVDLRNQHYLYFKFPKSRVMKDREIEVREMIENFNEWNSDLFSILQLKIEFSGNSWVNWAGLYGNKKISINSIYESDMWDTAIHEIGHAWHFQLCDLAKFSKEEESKTVVQDVAKYLGWKIRRINLKKAREMLWEKISRYSGTNWNEAFAEIFKVAYQEKRNLSLEEQLIKKACRNAIELYNNRIIEKLWSK